MVPTTPPTLPHFALPDLGDPTGEERGGGGAEGEAEGGGPRPHATPAFAAARLPPLPPPSPSDYVDFVDEFRAVEAERVIRSTVVRVLDAALAAGAVRPEQVAAAALAAAGGDIVGRSSAPPGGPSSPPYERVLFSPLADAVTAVLCQPAILSFLASPACPRVNLGVLETALGVCGRRCREWDDAELDSAAGVAPETLLSPADWQVLRFCDPAVAGGPAEQAPRTRDREAAARDAERRRNERQDLLVLRLKRKARRLQAGGGTDTALIAAVAALLAKLASAASAGGAEIDADDVDEDDGPPDAGDEEPDDAGGDSSDEGGGGDSDGGGGAGPTAAAKGGGASARAPPAGAPVSARGARRQPLAPPPPPSASALAARTRATVSTASRRIWREKLESLGADTAALDDDVGNPPATLSSTAPGELAAALATTAPITPKKWRACVRAICKINTSLDCQPTLNAMAPKNIWWV